MIFMWSTVEEYAILAPKRLPGLPETPGFLKLHLLHQDTIVFEEFNWSTVEEKMRDVPSRYHRL